MGVLLSKPNTDKVYDEGENSVIAYAACSMQVRTCNLFPAAPIEPAVPSRRRGALRPAASVPP